MLQRQRGIHIRAHGSALALDAEPYYAAVGRYQTRRDRCWTTPEHARASRIRAMLHVAYPWLIWRNATERLAQSSSS